MPPMPLTIIFDDPPVPRRDIRNKLHRLTDILTIATCAVIGGAESWEAIAEYGRTKADFFRRFLPLDNGISSSDTFERVFAKLARGLSPRPSADGWRRPARPPGWSRSSSTASRRGEPSGIQPPGA